jgi:hypothetical protein
MKAKVESVQVSAHGVSALISITDKDWKESNQRFTLGDKLKVTKIER